MNQERFYIETLGCQMNVYDSEFIGDVLTRAGWEAADRPVDASVILVNTCSVRARAEDKAIARVREYAALRRKNPDLVVGLVGCMAQRMGARLTRGRPKIDLVAGFDAYEMLPGLVREARLRRPVIEVCPEPRALFSSRPARRDGTAAFVTIMQGCDNFCSYCVVPSVRGRERSKACGVILEEIAHLVQLGTREVTLIGQNVNSYRDGQVDFAKLLELANDAPGLERIRFTTSHPKDLTLGLIERMRDLPKVCEHLHLPLQSGSDRILALMNRGYAFTDYSRIVEFARYTIPRLAVTTDIMVGFPTENEGDFEGTLGALEQLRFDAAFMFRYSPREGTRAADLEDDVPLEVKTGRLKAAVALQNSVTDEKKTALVGQEVEILVEGQSRRGPEFLQGRTRENWLAKIPCEGVRKGETVVAKVLSATRWMLGCECSSRKVGA
jgi:tRNA-2-methylthio-N6-dimethylallyladenosine synthase